MFQCPEMHTICQPLQTLAAGLSSAVHAMTKISQCHHQHICCTIHMMLVSFNRQVRAWGHQTLPMLLYCTTLISTASQMSQRQLGWSYKSCAPQVKSALTACIVKSRRLGCCAKYRPQLVCGERSIMRRTELLRVGGQHASVTCSQSSTFKRCWNVTFHGKA